MFYYAAFWNTVAAVDRELKMLNINSYKLLYLKDNISMRVIGFGWEDLIMHWFNNGKASTPEELALNLKIIVSKQQTHSIPTKPPLLLPTQKAQS